MKNEKDLADLHSKVEQQKSQWNLRARQPGSGQAAGKAETMQQSKSESHNPGTADGKAGLAAFPPDHFRAEKEDTQRDCGVERQQRGMA